MFVRSDLVAIFLCITVLATACSRGGNLDAGIHAYERKDYAAALKELRPVAESGNPEAQFRVGWMYREGFGVDRSDIEMVRWLKKAAKGGHAVAQHHLAFAYQVGVGVRENPEQAVYWHLKAADQGHAQSQIQLSILLEHGIGSVPKNVPGAYALLVVAPSASDPRDSDNATHRLGYLSRRLTPIEQTTGSALVHRMKAAGGVLPRELVWPEIHAR